MVIPEINSLWKDTVGTYCIEQVYKSTKSDDIFIGYRDLVSGDKWASDLQSWTEENYTPIETDIEFFDKEGLVCKIAYVNPYPLRGSMGVVIIRGRRRVKVSYSELINFRRKEDDKN